MARITAFVVAALLPFAGFAQQTVVLRDGTRITGSLVRADENSITFREENGQRRNFDTNQVQAIQFDRDGGNRAFGDRRNNDDRSGNTPNNAPYNRDRSDSRNPNYNNNSDPNGSNNANSNYGNRGNSNRNYMTIPSGTELTVRTNEAINAQNSDTRNYSAQIDRDVVDRDGNVLVPRGSEAQLVVRNSGDRQVALDLQSISVSGRRYIVDSGEVTQQQSQGREGVGANRRTGEYVGGGAVLGTLLGAIAGGGKGAAIGALAGAAAGAGTQVLTRGSQVKVPAETVLNFRLDNPLTLR